MYRVNPRLIPIIKSYYYYYYYYYWLDHGMVGCCASASLHILCGRGASITQVFYPAEYAVADSISATA